MRAAFEAWAQKYGNITQRRWVIWQAALAHGKAPGGRKTAAQKEAEAQEKAKQAVQRAPAIAQADAAVRNQVLNEVLDAFSSLGGAGGLDDILKVVQSLKQKQDVAPEQTAKTAERSVLVQTVLDHRQIAGVGCVLSNDVGKWFVTTPARISLRKSASPLRIDCKQEGTGWAYEKVDSKVNSSLWGNL
eukprot:gene16787-16603_t